MDAPDANADFFRAQQQAEYRRRTEGRTNFEDAEERDEEIISLADEGPIWTQLTVDLGFFRKYQRAARRLRKLHRKGLIQFRGRYLTGHEGNLSVIFCNWEIKEDTMAHELSLSRFLACYYGKVTIIRGYEAVDPKLRPDATMISEEFTYQIEMHTGKQRTHSRIKQRLRRFRGCPDTIIYVVMTAGQGKLIRELARAVNKELADDEQISVFTGILPEIVKAPLGPVWTDLEEDTCELALAATQPE